MSERSVPDTFLEGVKYALGEVGRANITLKPKQEEILKIIALKQKDVLAVLPTGYGKSLIYQIIPPLMDYMDSDQRPTQKKSIVLVVSLLNALIKDQVTKLKQSGLKACILKGDRVEGDEEERKEEQEVLAFSAIENLREFQLIFAHPEALVGNKNGIKLLKTTEFKNRIKVIVVDEAHLVVDWKNFRPSYGKLATIGSILPQVPLLGLTATATKKTRTDIIESLGMVNPVAILGNPDRPNIS
ncbi:probable ATP-dependent DNA helicase RecS [Acropora millepora]|uniref:probable ATP-dependent DNA helicase RecS n=1 Tax=Acropora millepora TaxID=45264 RepID=UPI001CF533CE|nr:probable ATP-dependent DNA helicase RecS [Acropora millepora]